MKHEYLKSSKKRTQIIIVLSVVGLILVMVASHLGVVPPELFKQLIFFHLGLVVAWSLTQFGWYEYKEKNRQAEVERLNRELRLADDYSIEREVVADEIVHQPESRH